MIRHYNAEIIKTNTNLKLSYRNGKFYKLELLSGKLTELQVKKLGMIIPPTEEAFADYNKELNGSINYTVVLKNKTLYQEFVDAWFAFYTDFMGVKPRFLGADGKHLKQIINYLKQVAGTEDKALELWKIVLDAWSNLDDFHQENTDLKYINSRLNVILNNVKRINGSGKDHKNDFR